MNGKLFTGDVEFALHLWYVWNRKGIVAHALLQQGVFQIHQFFSLSKSYSFLRIDGQSDS